MLDNSNVTFDVGVEHGVNVILFDVTNFVNSFGKATIIEC